MFKFKRYPQGNFGWHHLWYLAYVFVYSVVGLPLFLIIQRYSQFTRHLAQLSTHPILIIGIPILWLWTGRCFFNTYFPASNGQINELNKHFHYFTMFIAGFVLGTQPLFWANLLRLRRFAISIAVILTIVQYFYYWKTDYNPIGWKLEVQALIVVINSWCILLTIFGYAYRYLNFSNKFLIRSNQAVYPFYILHQTVIVCLAFPLINSLLPIWVKFGYLVVATFLICLALYD